VSGAGGTRPGAAGARRAATFPCARCGRPLRRDTRARPPRIRCARCGYLIYDYPRPCAGLIVVRDDRVLLLRRAAAPRRGCVDVPGGFLDAGEDLERAARRELREETGLTVGPAEPLGTYWDRYHLRGFGWIPTMNVYFAARWRRGEPVAADDAASAEWVPFARLGTRAARYAWKHMRPLLRDARRWAGR
jgi:8-oxo-dGTP diphosphatase